MRSFLSGRRRSLLAVLATVTTAVVAVVLLSGSPAGAHTADVRLIQRDLAGLSYLPLSGVDGIYGPRTTGAVRQYQADNGLAVDGDAGPITTDSLKAKVRRVQRVAGTAADGDYGPNTRAAVTAWQRAHRLAADGIAGPATMRAMGIPRVVGGGGGGGGGGTPAGLRGAIVRAARSQIGVHEGANNCNPYGPCEAWCALFASWTWRQGGVPDIGRVDFTGNFYYWGQRHRTLHSGLSGIRPGDVVLFGTGPQNTRTSVHIGVVERALSDGRIVTIEGNYADHVARVGPYRPSSPSPFHSSHIYAVVSPAA